MPVLGWTRHQPGSASLLPRRAHLGCSRWFVLLLLHAAPFPPNGSVLFICLPVMIPVPLCQRRLLIWLPRSSRPSFLFLFFTSFCFYIVCLIFFPILFSRHPSLRAISNICCANIKMYNVEGIAQWYLYASHPDSIMNVWLNLSFFFLPSYQVCVCVCVWSTDRSLRTSLGVDPHLPPCLRWVSLLFCCCAVHTKEGHLSGSGNFPVCLPSHHRHTGISSLGFLWVFGIWTQVCILICKSFSRWAISSAPQSKFYVSVIDIVS